MAQKNINLGSADYAGDGENIRSAFAKIQDNFTELFNRPTTEAGNTLQIDVQGNVVGADSALIINSSDSSITAGGGITGDLTGDVTGTVSGISNHDLSSLGNVSTAVPTTGQVLKWNGSEWAPGTDNTGSGGSDGGSFSFIVAADDSVQRIINNQETLSVIGGTNLNTSANPEAAVTINLDTSISLDSVTTTSLFTSTIDTTDSSSLTITPSVVMSSDLTVENTLNLTNAVNLPAGSTLNGQSLSVTDGITEVVQDTSPQLGGNLDLNNFDITGTGNIPAANLSGALPAIDGSALTGVTVSSIAFSNVTSTPTTLAGYGITDAYTQTQVDTAITNATSSIVIPSGSSQSIDIVAADSTLLVDSVNGTLNATTLTGALPAIDGSALTGVTTTETDPVVGAITGIVKSDGAGNISSAVAGTDYLTTVAFADLTGTPTTIAGYGITDALTAGGALTGSSLEAVAVGAGVADGNDLAVTGGDATEVNSIGGDANITGGSGALQPGNVNIGATQTTLVTIGSGSNNVDFPNGTAVDFTGATVTGLNFYTDSDVDTHLNTSTANSSEVLSWNGSDYAWVAQSGGSSTQLAEGNSYASISDTGSNGEFAVFIDGNFEMRVRDTGMRLGASSGIEVDTILDEDNMASDSAKALATQQSIKAYVDANSGGASSRGTVTGTTSSLADAAEADLDITGFKSYALLTITTDRAARVRLYVNAATRTADASRAEGVDPTSDAGLIAEVITTGADTVIISPGAYGFNLESSPTTTIPCRVTNKSGSASTVQVDLNILQLEA